MGFFHMSIPKHIYIYIFYEKNNHLTLESHFPLLWFYKRLAMTFEIVFIYI